MTKNIFENPELKKYKHDLINLVISALLAIITALVGFIATISGIISHGNLVSLAAPSFLIVSIIALLAVIYNLFKLAKTFITSAKEVQSIVNHLKSSVYDTARKDVTDD